MNLFLVDHGLLLLSALGGAIFGWLIATLRSQRHQAALESENRVSLQRIEQLTLDKSEQLKELLQLKQQFVSSENERHQLHSSLAAVNEKLMQQTISRDEWRDECEKLNQELRLIRELNSSQEAEIRELTIRLEETKLSAEEKQRLLTNSEQRLTTQFENLANRIFEQSGRKVNEQNQQSLDGLLTPLKEQMESFRRQIQDSFGEESKERHTLTHEIRNLQKLNAQMAQEAINLTQALKGDNKTQGNWGEVILGKVLEASGLREGYEYETQVALNNERGERQQPDVVVHLPQKRDVIIDAKVSLIAYERYFNSDDKAHQAQALQEHVASVRNHIRLLSRKNYQTLSALQTLDYVLLFIPVEPAFMLAIEKEPELINDALKQNIILVSPTTLLVALRTISNLWRFEYQSQNTKEIAIRAARLYDKVRLFVDDLLTIGQSIDKAHCQYESAMNKLAQGRGNIISQVESFRQLGVDIKKEIAPEVVAESENKEPRTSNGVAYVHTRENSPNHLFHQEHNGE